MVIMKVHYLSIPGLLSRLACLELSFSADYRVMCDRARSQELKSEIRNGMDAAGECGGRGSGPHNSWIGPNLYSKGE